MQKIFLKLIFFVFLFSPLTNIAQHLASSRTSSYLTYIYKLENNQVKKRLKNQFTQIIPELKNIVDSFPSDSIYKKELKAGHYMFVKAVDENVVCRFETICPFDVKIFNNYNETSFVVFNLSDGKRVEDASIELNGKIVRFDPITKTYNVKKAKVKSELIVTVNGLSMFYSLERQDERYYYSNNWKLGRVIRKVSYSFPLRYILWPFRRAYRAIKYAKYNRTDVNGYIAFNKPKYLLKDTVKMKAFITDYKGRPINKRLTVELKKGYSHVGWDNLAKIKPKVKGEYLFNFVIADTLELNNDYTINLKNKRGETLIQRSFYLEDYQLDETSYFIKPEKNEYFPNQAIIFNAVAKDANGLPILDGRIDLNGKVEQIISYVGDEVFVPNKLWKHAQSLEADGETKIVFPDSIIPNAELKIKIEAIFNNSNNETHSENFAIQYLPNHEEIKVKTENESIVAEYLFNNISKEAKGNLISLSYNGDTVSKQKITFPFKQNVNTAIKTYVFLKDKISTHFNISQSQPTLFNDYHRTKDSLFYVLENPNRVDLKYNVYRSDKLIEKGNTKDINLAIKADNTDPYTIRYFYIWGGEKKEKSLVINLFDKELSVTVDQPEKIFPGEKVKVSIKVKDFKNNAVPGVNLTASSVNGQFTDLKIPELPYLGKPKKNKLKIGPQYAIEKQEVYSITQPLNKGLIKRMRLDTISYYKMLFPEGGQYFNYDSIGLDNAQFAPYVFRNGKMQPIYLIYLDDKLVYYYNTIKSNNYSFNSKGGYHNIRIRCADTTYIIYNVLLCDGYKLDISIDADHLPENVFTFQSKNYLELGEISLLRSRIFFFNSENYGENVFIWQNREVFAVKNTNYRNVYSVGPFDIGTMNFAKVNEYRTDFIFEPGFDYTVQKGLIKMYSNNHFIENAILPKQIQKTSMGAVSIPLSDIKYEPEVPKVEVWTHLYTDNPYFTNGENSTYTVESTTDSVFVLIKLQRLDTATFLRYYDGSERTFYDLPEGYYRLKFITANGNYFEKDSIRILPNGFLFHRYRNPIFKSNIIFPTPIKGPEVRMENLTDYSNLNGENGTLKITLTDKKTGETIPFAAIILYKGGIEVTKVTSDIDGEAKIKYLTPGLYNLTTGALGYTGQKITNVIIYGGKTNYVNIALNANIETLSEFEIVQYKVPLIDPDYKSGGTVTREEYRGMATKSINSVASLTAGVYQATEVLNVRGSRGDGTVYFIDGQRVIGSSGLPQNAIEQIAENKSSIPASFGDSVINNLSEAERNSKQIRNNFSDYAYWQPNLITDEKGEATFEAVFPDNTTTWKSYALAMDDNRRTGKGYASTKSYKNLMVNLSVPRFMLRGDSAIALGKTFNRSNTSLKIKTSFYINDNLISTKDTLLDKAFLTPLSLANSNISDTLKVKYINETTNGFKDGEVREIPVFEIGSEESIGQFLNIEKDTSISIKLKPNAKTNIYVQANALDFIFSELDQIKNYPYACMEQCASKLKAYLMEKEIVESLGQNFKHEKEIKQLLSKLNKGQQPNGSWGWWESSYENVFMSAYVSDALLKAKQSGYFSEVIYKAEQYLLSRVNQLKGNELLQVLHTLADFKSNVNFTQYIDTVMKDSLSNYQKMQIIHLKQKTGLNYSIKTILNTKKETVLGACYWGEESYSWYDNSINSSLLAYRILEKNDSTSKYLPMIRNYLIELKSKSKWHNTYQAASILETILPTIVKQSGKEIKKPIVILKGAINKTIIDFPYSATLENNITDLQIQKTGTGFVYFTSYQKLWNDKPTSQDSLYSIKSYFEAKSKKVTALTAGEIADLVVIVDVKKKADYVMLEIPIPAGCSYNNEKSSPNHNEAHREYFKNKTSIFCEHLNPGKYEFRVKLQPRFTGSYTLNPVKVELMYFPTFFGRNDIRKVKIN